jgi:WD40 repeat protein
VLAGVLAADVAVPRELVAATREAALVALTAPAAVGSLKALAFVAVVLVAGVGSVAVLTTASRERPEVAQTPAAASSPQPAALGPRVDSDGLPLPPGVLARIGSSRLRHASWVQSVAVAPDGKTLASAGSDGVRIWDLATGKLLQFVSTSALPSDDTIGFSADGREILWVKDTYSQSQGEYVRLDVATGRKQLRVALPNASSSSRRVAFSSQRFAYVRQDKSISICDTATGLELKTIPDREPVTYGLALSPDDRTLAVVNFDDTITLYDTTTGAKSGELKRDLAQFRSVAFSPDGRTLAGVHSDYEMMKEVQVHLWDLETRRHRVQLPTKDVGRMAPIIFARDGRSLLTVSLSGGPILSDATTGQELRRFQRILGTSGGGGVSCAAFTADGKTLVGGIDSGTLALWDVSTGRLLPQSANPAGGVDTIRFSNDSRHVIGQASRAMAWDAATGREVGRYAELPVSRGDFILSPDRRLLAAISDDALRTWDAVTSQEIREMSVEQLRPFGVPVFTPDGRRLAVTAADATVNRQEQVINRIAVWDVATGRHLATMTSGGTIWKLLVSPDGRWLVAPSSVGLRGGDSTVRVWDLTTYQEVRRFAPHRRMYFSIAISPDSRWLAAVGSVDWVRGEATPEQPGQIHVWDIENGRELRRITGLADQFSCSAFSADGRMLATGNHDGTIRLWEVATGQERHRLTGHKGFVRELAFAPDGRTLVAASFDAPVYVWDVLGRLEPPAQPPLAADLEQAWAALASADAKAAFKAIRRLVAAPEPAIAFLREKLPRATPADAAQVRELVRQLDSPQFSERQQATKELEKLADAAAAELRTALKDAATLEVRWRLQQLVDQIENGTPETLRAQRAVEALEYIGTPAAWQHLRALAGGAPGAALTDAATAALKRLAQ